MKLPRLAAGFCLLASVFWLPASAAYFGKAPSGLVGNPVSSYVGAAIYSESSPAPEPTPSFLTVTNAQKLALTGISVGQVVHVSDGVVMSGSGSSEVNGFYTERGVSEGRDYFVMVGYEDNLDGIAEVLWTDEGGGIWYIYKPDGDLAYLSHDDTEYPWQVTTWIASGSGVEPFPTLTHPAVQQLAAPSTAQGGVFVSGVDAGSAAGIWLNSGISEGKQAYAHLGIGDDQVNWHAVGPNGDAWYISLGGGDPLFYSLSDVATPDLAANWKNASDDTPASITVTSVTQGELDAGVTVAGAGTSSWNGVFPFNPASASFGSEPGMLSYTKLGESGVAEGNHNIYYQWTMYIAGDENYYSSADEEPLVWDIVWEQAVGDLPVPTVTRNDIAAEANWDVVP